MVWVQNLPQEHKLTIGVLVLRELFMMGPYTFDMLCQENSVFDLSLNVISRETHIDQSGVLFFLPIELYFYSTEYGQQVAVRTKIGTNLLNFFVL